MSVGPTELGLRGNQEFLTLILNPNTAVFFGRVYVNYLGLELGAYIRIIFWVSVWVRVRVYNGL